MTYDVQKITCCYCAKFAAWTRVLGAQAIILAHAESVHDKAVDGEALWDKALFESKRRE